MPTLSPTIAETARKNEMAVLQAFARVSQTRVAELMGVSDSTVTRFKDGGIEQACALLAACGLKAVPIEMKCFPEETVHALLTLSKHRLESIEHPNQLVWD